MTLLKAIWAAIQAFFAPPVVVPPVPSQPEPTYLWDTDLHIRHTVRVLCDEEGLNLEQKDTLFATVWEESQFKLNAKRENFMDGSVWSTDWGICQWNDYFHHKEITPYEAVHDPEKAVRLMCEYWKRNQRNQWSAYKSGAYRKHL